MEKKGGLYLKKFKDFWCWIDHILDNIRYISIKNKGILSDIIILEKTVKHISHLLQPNSKYIYRVKISQKYIEIDW